MQQLKKDEQIIFCFFNSRGNKTSIFLDNCISKNDIYNDQPIYLISNLKCPKFSKIINKDKFIGKNFYN